MRKSYFNKAASVPVAGVIRSRITSYENHRRNCVTVKNDAGVALAGCVLVGTGAKDSGLCPKGSRLLAEIDNPPPQVNNPPGPLSKELRKAASSREWKRAYGSAT